MTVIHANIVPKWRLNFTDNYIVADNNKVYNTKTNTLLQMQLKGYTKGYYLHGKFYSLNVLRKHLVKIEKIKYGKRNYTKPRMPRLRQNRC